MAVAQTFQLLAVRYGDLTQPTVIEFPTEDTIPVSDERQSIDLLCTGRNPQPLDTKRWKNAIADLNEAERGGTWYRFSLEDTFKSSPLLTTLDIEFNVPKDTSLRLYLIPSRVFSIEDIQGMLEEIREELSVDAAWAPGTDQARGFSTPTSSSFEIEESLVHAVEQELRAAEQVRKTPYRELNERAPLPENAIVSHWALKRIRDLKRLSTEANSSAQALEERAKHSPNRYRKVDAERDASRYQGLAQAALRLIGRAVHHINPAELNTPFPFGPAAQRDYRLRRLLRAFAAPLIEIPVARPMQSAAYPTTRYSSIYELWCAAAMVRRLRREHFDIRLAQATPGLKARSYQWHCSRDGLIITIDFEPSPVPLTFENLPAARDRSEPAWQLEVRNRLTPGQFFSCSPKCTPDYLIRLERQDRAVLLIGDASAVSVDDVEKQKPDDRKTTKVAEYVSNIGWVREKHVILRPSPLGGFALLPGSQASWDAMPLDPSGPDVAIFGFHPGETGRAGLDAWCEYVMGQLEPLISQGT